MSKSDIMIELKKQKIVLVIRGKTITEGLHSAIACIDSGIKAIEIAYTNQHATGIIKELNYRYKKEDSVCIGAGTVLDAVTAREAILAGAKYIVSPSFNLETAQMCNLYAVPYIPGCMTLTEITHALEAGSEMIKLFPGNALSPNYISAVKAPLPQVSIMVTGGVNLDNAHEWFAAGADAIGIGGKFNKLAAQGDYDAISATAQQYALLRDSSL